jgi:hypothetical protein
MKKLYSRYIVVAVILYLSLSTTVHSAPFCAIFSYGKNCWYFSYDECLEAAGGDGACVTNQEEIRPPSGSGRFCVVSSFGTNCSFFDASS